MYYFSHLTMDAIARELHTSRPTVSRLLRFARDSGLVEVRLRTLQEAAPELEQSLAAAYGVTAHIVSVPDTRTPDIGGALVSHVCCFARVFADPEMLEVQRHVRTML